MKKLFLVLAPLLCLSIEANAAEVVVEVSSTTRHSPKAILDAVTDYENACDNGCKYRVKGLKETKVLEDDGDRQVVWQQINNVRTVKQFLVNEVRTLEDGTMILSSQIPENKTLEELKAKYDLPHSTPFRSMKLVWEARTSKDGQTFINGSMKVDHNLPRMANGIIRNSIRASLNEVLANLENI